MPAFAMRTRPVHSVCDRNAMIGRCTMTLTANPLPPCYVLWFGPTGLTIARSLGRRGVPVVALHDDANEPCLSSRFIKPLILPRLSDDPQAWLAALMAEGAGLAPRKAALMPASDETWLFIARHAATLAEHFKFALPPGDEVERWPTKSFQHQGAAKCGIPHPRTAPIGGLDDLRAAARASRFPCLVKPTLSYRWVRQYGEKLSVARSASELLARGSDALERGLPFVVQELVPAPDHEVHGFVSYLDRQSRPLAWGVTRKVRQHEPLFGSSCMSRTIEQPRVAELGLRLLQGMGFHGISSVEFKRDTRDGEFKLMEINVRAPLMMDVVVRSGVDLSWIAYCDVLGLPQDPSAARFRPGQRTGHLMNDLHSMAYYRSIGQLSLAGWARSWVGARDLHFAWDDLRPFRRHARVLWERWRNGKYRRIPRVPSLEPVADEPAAKTPSALGHQLSTPVLPVVEVVPNPAASPDGVVEVQR